MDPERSNAEGVKLLRQYLQYVESGGTNLGDHVLEKPALNPFEVDVRDTLTRHGLKLTAQYSSSGYWIDFAAQHPTQPGRYVLAIECDGITYHSSQSARDRDRLRQEHLQRLGWRVCRIWSSEWFYNKNTSVHKVLDTYQDAVRDADRRAESDLKPNEAPTAATPLDPQTPERRPRPPLCRGLPIDDYTPSELLRLIRWIESDDQLRTEEELIIEAMNDLGFRRQGRKIVTALRTAIHQSRKPGHAAH